MLSTFWLIFIPLFVAVDPLGILPIFVNLTSRCDREDMHRIVIQSMVAALVTGILFLLGGKWILGVLGISIADFMIAGGILLFVLSINDIVSMQKAQRLVDPGDLGAVPIGVPLIVGPAVLATGILLAEQHGYPLTVAALCINILLAGTVLWFSPILLKILGSAGSKVLSKLAALLLASFAVMMIRKGLLQIGIL